MTTDNNFLDRMQALGEGIEADQKRIAELEAENRSLRSQIEHFNAQQERDRQDAKVCAYEVGGEIKVELAKQQDGSELWAVRRFGTVLNKSGEWEYEPLPSSRDDAFLDRCRFESGSQAIDAAMAAQGERTNG